jgi:osmotically-inducible protein OsmY
MLIKKTHTLMLLALGLGFAVPVSADYSSAIAATSFTSRNYQQNYHKNYISEADDTDSGIPDADLEKQIQDKLRSGWFAKGYEQVTVSVENGDVTLEGTVKSWEDKEKVEKEVRHIEGVKSLDSQLTVREGKNKDVEKRQFPQDTYGTSADDQLNKKIRDHVSKGWLWNSYKEVTLNTSNGTVTLEGSVDSLSDQQKLMTEIQKIDGVKSVKSNLRVKKR